MFWRGGGCPSVAHGHLYRWVTRGAVRCCIRLPSRRTAREEDSLGGVLRCVVEGARGRCSLEAGMAPLGHGCYTDLTCGDVTDELPQFRRVSS